MNLGIGARASSPGDFVCVLFGGKIPFLSIPLGSICIFMEGCYLNGVMHGEAIKEMEAGQIAGRWFEVR
jgi:hypothetical protein